MTLIIPETHKDLVTPPAFLTIVTVMPNSMPQSSVAWFLYEEDHFLVSIEKDSQKHRNLERNAKVGLFGIDPNNAYRYIEIRGKTLGLTPAAPEWIDDLCELYTGKKYFGVFMSEERSEDMLIAKIKPTRIRPVDLSFFNSD